MATTGALSRHLHFAELNEPLQTSSGWMTPEQRKAAARDNLGVASGTALSGVTSLTDNSGGTPSGTIAAIADGPTADAIASLNAKIDEIIAALS